MDTAEMTKPTAMIRKAAALAVIVANEGPHPLDNAISR